MAQQPPIRPIPIPIGQAGLIGTKNLARMTPEHLIEAVNITMQDGTLRAMGGALRYDTGTIASTLLGGVDWEPTDGTQRQVVVSLAGKINKDANDGNFAPILKTGLVVSLATVPVFVEAGKEAAAQARKLFLFTGTNAVQVLSGDGGSTTNISTPPSDWSGTNQPTFGAVHENRLWAGGNANDPHRLYYPGTASHEDFSAGGSFAIYPTDGGKVVGALSFKGLLIVWKWPRGIYYIDTTDPTIANWKVRRISREIGGVSPLGMVAIENDVLFMDGNGNIHAISAVDEFGNLGMRAFSDMHEMKEFVSATFRRQYLPRIKAVFYADQRQVIFAMPGMGSIGAMDSYLFIDFNRPDLPRFLFGSRDSCNALWLRRDGNGILRPMIGDTSGFVYQLDQDARTKNGANYVASWRTADYDFGEPGRRKVGVNALFVMRPVLAGSMTVRVQWDDFIADTITVNPKASGDLIGSTFIMNSSRLASGRLVTRRYPLNGSGYRLSLEGSATSDFAVMQIVADIQLEQ